MKIKKDCEYRSNDVRYYGGMEVSHAPEIGDIYIEGDYLYQYKEIGIRTAPGKKYETASGWEARVRNYGKSSFEPLLGEINGKPLISLANTFRYCEKLQTSPVIPDTVLVMDNTFDESGLIVAPKLPKNVKNMVQTFKKCKNLIYYMDENNKNSKDKGLQFGDFREYFIPESVSVTDGMFEKCENMFRGAKIGKNIRSARAMYKSCTHLSEEPIVENGVENLEEAFYRCYDMAKNVVFPNSVKNLKNTCSHCHCIQNILNWPIDVENIDGVCYSCGNLETVPKLTTSIKAMDSAFSNCIKLNQIEEIPKSVESAAFAFQKCYKFTKIPKMYNIENMQGMFIKCDGIKGKAKITWPVDNLKSTFFGCSELKIVELHNDVNQLDSDTFAFTNAEIKVRKDSKLDKKMNKLEMEHTFIESELELLVRTFNKDLIK